MSPRPDATPKAKWCGPFEVVFSIRSMGWPFNQTFANYREFLDFLHEQTAKGRYILITDVINAGS
jgi:hypothetical protein